MQLWRLLMKWEVSTRPSCDGIILTGEFLLEILLITILSDSIPMESESITLHNSSHTSIYLSHILLVTLVSSQVFEWIFQELYIHNWKYVLGEVIFTSMYMSTWNETKKLNITRRDDKGRDPQNKVMYCLCGSLL